MRVDSTADRAQGWAAHLRPGALRFARATSHYEETIAFYRDLVGLPVIDGFTDSFGEDGTIFGLPDSSVHLEIVRAHDSSTPAAGAFDQLVLYLDDTEAVASGTAALREAGLAEVAQPHAYWAANGAAVFRDPDGRDVVFAPWVYGRDPDPIDSSGLGSEGGALRVAWYHGDRDDLRPLFEEAEDSRPQLDSYLRSGRVLVAWQGADLVGHLQLVPTGREGEVELKNVAVLPERRGTGIGRTLVDAALRLSADAGLKRMVVATAAADVGNLRFYQRCGFRLTSVDRDAFTPATGYPDPIIIEGIPLLDRVWLAQDQVS